MFLASNHQEATTYIPETSTKYETTEMNTTTLQETTQTPTTSSNILGKFINEIL